MGLAVIAKQFEDDFADANAKGLAYARIVDFALSEFAWIHECGDAASSARAEAAIDHIRACNRELYDGN